MPGASAVLLVLLVLQAPAGAEPPPTPPAPARANGSATERDRPITHLFQNLVKDSVSLPSRGSATILAAGGGAALAIRPADDNLQSWAAGLGSSSYTRLGRDLGDGWVQGGAALATYGIGLVAKHREAEHVGSDLIRAQALNAVITRVTKTAVGRHRPGGSHDSLPSGHASATFATAAVLGGHYGWEVGVPAYAVAGFVGWTRVRDQSHWATDTVLGATVGAIVGYTVTRGHREHEWVLVPAVSPGRASISVVHVPRSAR